MSAQLRCGLAVLLGVLALLTLFIWIQIYPQVTDHWSFAYGLVTGFLITAKVVIIVILAKARSSRG